MARADEVVTVGLDWRQWPPSTWGSRDRAQALIESQRESGIMPLAVAPLPRLSPGFTKPRARGRGARSDAIDALLDDLGVPSRRRAR